MDTKTVSHLFDECDAADDHIGMKAIAGEAFAEISRLRAERVYESYAVCKPLYQNYTDRINPGDKVLVFLTKEVTVYMDDSQTVQGVYYCAKPTDYALNQMYQNGVQQHLVAVGVVIRLQDARFGVVWQHEANETIENNQQEIPF